MTAEDAIRLFWVKPQAEILARYVAAKFEAERLRAKADRSGNPLDEFAAREAERAARGLLAESRLASRAAARLIVSLALLNCVESRELHIP